MKDMKRRRMIRIACVLVCASAAFGLTSLIEGFWSDIRRAISHSTHGAPTGERVVAAGEG